MLIGIEKILKKESPFLFIFMVFLSVVSNFYFFYMIGCNVIIYVLIRLISKYHTNIKRIMQHLLCITGYTITGICTGSFMLIPVLNLLLRTDRASNESSFELLYNSHYYKNFLEDFLIPSTSKHHTYMGFSFIVVVCILLLFMERKKHTELKAAFVVMTCFLFLPMAGKVLHGFSYTSNRWAFGYVLLLATITTIEWKNLFYLSKKKLGVSIAAILVITAGYAIKMHLDGKINRNLQDIFQRFHNQ
ncbi:MAG: YfhO family protein [Clostridiales bacterium]|nr:YfhO family protein [Clostridiales bacterium]